MVHACAGVGRDEPTGQRPAAFRRVQHHADLAVGADQARGCARGRTDRPYPVAVAAPDRTGTPEQHMGRHASGRQCQHHMIDPEQRLSLHRTRTADRNHPARSCARWLPAAPDRSACRPAHARPECAARPHRSAPASPDTAAREHGPALATASSTRIAMAQTEGPCRWKCSDAALSCSAFSTRLTPPLRYRSTAFDRCRPAWWKPSVRRKLASSGPVVSSTANSRNSTPSRCGHSRQARAVRSLGLGEDERAKPVTRDEPCRAPHGNRR